MRNAVRIARRDLSAYFNGPAGLLIAALFLALQGTVFWIFVRFLGRPDAPPAGLMEIFFGGTMLYWVAVALIAAALPMRLIAEERRLGTLETLLTAPVGFGEIIFGKWLAAFVFQAMLWSTTALYVPFLASIGAPADLGALIAGFLGTISVGAATLGIGVFASTVTRHQLVAAAASLVSVFLFLLIGAVAHQATTPWLAAALERASLFRLMEDFGRGVVDSRALVFLATVTCLPLIAAARVLGWDRPPRIHRRQLTDAVAAVLLVAIAVFVNLLSERHFVRADWTKGALFSLSPKAISVAQALPKPVEVQVFRYPERRSESDRVVGSLLSETLERLAHASSGRVTVTFIDPDRSPSRAEQAARAYGISPHEMSEGAVVVKSGERSRVVTRDDLVDEEVDLPTGMRALRAFRGEAALVSAMLTVSEDRAPTICFTQSHGEPRIDSTDPGGYATFADDLRRDAYAVRALDKLDKIEILAKESGPSADRCDVLVLAEPATALASRETDAIDRYLRSGGSLLLMLGPVFDRSGNAFRLSGAEKLLARFGIGFLDAVIVDPVHGSDVEGPSVWIARDSAYASHAASARLEGRATTWSRTRPLTIGTTKGDATAAVTGATGAAAIVTALVHSSADSWAETDLPTLRGEADLHFDPPRDTKGPLTVAAAVEEPLAERTRSRHHARVVAFGTGRLVTNDRLAGLLVRDYNVDFTLSAIAWLADREIRSGIGAKVAPARAVVDVAAAGRAFWLFVVGLPSAMLIVGGLIWWRRRV